MNKRESVGLDFHYKMVVVDGREVKLQIFDHRSTRWRRPGEVGRGSVDVSANFLRKAAGLLLCFSLTDRLVQPCKSFFLTEFSKKYQERTIL